MLLKKNMLDQNKKINIIFGILLVLLVLSVLQTTWALGITKSSTDKGYSFGKPVRQSARELPFLEQDSVLRQAGQYFGSIYSEAVLVCKKVCASQCAANGKNGSAELACGKGCEDYYAQRSDQETKDGLRALHTACKK